MGLYGGTPDATSTKKGKLMLANDISGSADSPQIVSTFADDSKIITDTTLPASRDFRVLDLMEVGSSNVLEIPATSSLEVYSPVLPAYYVCTSTTRPAIPSEGWMIYETDTNLMLVYNGSGWVHITPQSNSVTTQESSASHSYGDLTTVGPTVSNVMTGTSALINLSCYASSNTNGDTIYYSVAVSGATTIAAADANGVAISAPGANFAEVIVREYILTGLTPGQNTFTAKYKTSAGTGTWVNRSLTITGIP